MSDNLRKLTLTHDKKSDEWKLKDDQSNRTIRTFDTKSDATAGGVLRGTLGPNGGSVKIQKEDGTFQEERTFPRSKDPRKSRG